MKLTSLNVAEAANAGRVLHLLHPVDRTPLYAGEGKERKPVTFTLLGKDSDAFIKAANSARNVQAETLIKGGKPSAAAADVQGNKALADCTVAWSGVPQGWIDSTDDETPAAHSAEAAFNLYSNPGVRWVRDQVDEFVGAREHFLKP